MARSAAVRSPAHAGLVSTRPRGGTFVADGARVGGWTSLLVDRAVLDADTQASRMELWAPIRS